MQFTINFTPKNLLLKVNLLWIICCCCILQGQAQIGQALHFDGYDDFVDLGSTVFYQNSFTIEGWIRPEFNVDGGDNQVQGKGPFKTDETIFSARTNDNKTAIFLGLLANGKLRFLVRPVEGEVGGMNVLSDNTVTEGGWHHFAAVKGNDDKLYIYLDGELESTSNDIVQNGVSGTVSDFGERLNHSLRLGIYRDPDQQNVKLLPSLSWHYKGLMDEIRFWNTARSEAEIKNNMNVILTGNETGLASYYRFEEGGANSDNTSIQTLTDTKAARQGTLKNFELDGSTSNFTEFYSMVNVALGMGTQTSQSSSHASYPISTPVNGLKTNPFSQTGKEDDPYWQVDLGSIQNISEIRVWNRSDNCCWRHLQNFYIIVSKDPILDNSTVSSANKYVSAVQSFTNQDELYKTLTFPNDVQGRYVRVFLNKANSELRIREVEVFVKQTQKTKNILANPDPISEGIWFVIQNKSLVDDDLSTPADRKALMLEPDGIIKMGAIPLEGNYDNFLWRAVKKEGEYILINKAMGWEKILEFQNNSFSLQPADLNYYNNSRWRRAHRQRFMLSLSNRAKHGTNAYTISNVDMTASNVIQYSAGSLSKVTKQANDTEQVWLFQPMELVKGYSIPQQSNGIFKYRLDLPHNYQVVATEHVDPYIILNDHLVVKNMLTALQDTPHETLINKRSNKTVVIFATEEKSALNTNDPNIPYVGTTKIGVSQYNGGESSGLVITPDFLTVTKYNGEKREFDHIVHEFSHHIHDELNLNTTSSTVSAPLTSQKDSEWFPNIMEWWFNSLYYLPSEHNRDNIPSEEGAFISTVFQADNTWFPPRRLRNRDETIAPPVTNNALHFDGSNDFIEIGNTSFHQESFTVEGWIKPEGTGVGAIFHTSFNARFSAIYAEVMSNGKIRFLIRNPPNNAGGAYIIGETNVTDGQWHHFAAIKRDDDKLYLYIDGEEDGVSSTTIQDFPNTDEHVMVLGMNWAGSRRHYKGKMDEISFWNRARTPAEIQAKSKALNVTQENQNGLIAYYKFDQGVINGSNDDITHLVEELELLNGKLKNFQLLSNDSNFTEGVPEN